METTTPLKWISDQSLATYYGVHRSTVWRWTKAGKLPAPEKIAENTTRWDMDKIKSMEAD